MTSMREAIVLGLLMPLAAFSAPELEWRWANPQPTGNNLIGIFFQDSLSGILVADNGELFATADGGETWDPRPGRIGTNTLVAATSRDGRGLLAADADGRIWKRAEGGAWKTTAEYPVFLYDIHACGSQAALAVGMGGLILRSTDQGETWTQVRPDSGGPDLLGVACVEDGHAFAAGEDGLLLRSGDFGRTWDSLPRPSGGILAGVAFADSARGFLATAEGEVLDTRDGGRTWRTTRLDSLLFLRGIRIEGERVTVTGSEGAVWKSADGGSRWTRSVTPTRRYLAASAFLGAAGEIAVGNDGVILRSDDGSVWRSVSGGSALELLGLAAISPTSWVAFGSEGAMLKTTDAGRSWTEQPVPGGFQAGSFHGRRGLVAGFGGTILFSEDAGDSWREAETPGNPVRLFGVAWSDSLTAVAVGDSAAVWRTTDGGRAWSALAGIPGLAGQTLSAVVFTPDGVGFIAGYGGTLLRSFDGGATWTRIAAAGTEDLFGIAFRDATVGMAVGARGTVLTTRNGGDTWTPGTTGERDDYVFGVAWLGGDTALALADWLHYSAFRLTVDGGLTWTAAAVPTESLLWAIAGLGDGRAAVLGQDGTILVGTLRHGGTGVRGAGSKPRADAGLTVRRIGRAGRVQAVVDMAQPAPVTLSAFSLDGRLLRRLFHGRLARGRHTLHFDLPGSRGPILFRLEAEGRFRDGRTARLPPIPL